MRKGKNKTEEDLDNLKIDYMKLPLSIRTTGWVKHRSNGDKKSKKKILELIGGKRKFKMLNFEKML
ncbi:hypothetical protein Goshw_012679 [Gossypium schwendimanii]|uniref:Uncharacterized protein n=1 Tax=Gossypium schwendimanii TaxID=34291 RepID=A0A7J9L9K7_GOSSC|nr:hypothetical protein [Gossypium schwendimanii]